MSASSLDDLATIRKRLKAREKNIIRLPEVVSMKSEDGTELIKRRYGVSNYEVVPPSLPALNEKPKEIEVKVEAPKKTKRKKMLRWPEDQTLLYKQLSAPIKDILEKGYRLIRRPNVEEVEYEGYNIGKHELLSIPSPKLRLTKDWLKYEEKLGNSLCDVALNILFLLGVEQGRRSERKLNQHIDHILATLKAYRDTNSFLRAKVDTLEATIEVRKELPFDADEEVKPLIEALVKNKRPERLAALQKEITLDPTAVGSIKRPIRTKFSNALAMSNIISTDTTKDQWKAYLNEVGWSYEDWKRVCKKRKIKQLSFKPKK